MELSTKNVVNTLRKEYADWIEILTEKEKYAIEKYSWNSFDRINGKTSFFQRLNSMLRGLSTEEDSMLEEYSNIISNAIAKHTIEHSVVCYRGSDYDMTDGTPVGEMFVGKSFISTSVIRSRKIGGKYEFIIHVPQGAYVAYIENLSRYKSQRELLIDKNTLYKVVARNGYLVELEVQI